MRNRRHICTAVLAMSMLLLMLMSGCSISLDFSFGGFSSPKPEGSSLFGNTSYPDWEENSLDNSDYLSSLDKKFTYYPTSAKNKLYKDEQELYQRILARIENDQFTFRFEDISNDTFKAAYYAVLDDHPEYFWLSKSYSYGEYRQGVQSVLKVEPSLFSDDTETIHQAAKDLEKAVKNIVAGAEQQENLFYKVKYVHDYIIDHTVYDTEAMEQVFDAGESIQLHAATAYGCLVEHKAICSGYAAAFQLVMQRLGIECGRVNGMKRSETAESHQWNYVCLDNEYYYLDATWDDPVRPDGVPTRTYEYFLLSDDDLAYTHTIDEDQNVPVCSGTKYNFYVYNGLYFITYDFDKIRTVADKMAADNSLTVKFSVPEVLSAAQNDLIDNQRIFFIGYITGHITYSVSSSGCILTINY